MKSRDSNALTMEEHSRELRQRLILILTVLIISFLTFFHFSPQVLQLVTKIANTAGYDLVYIAPQEVLLQQIKVSGVLALVISLPVILTEVLCFISPVFENKKVTKTIVMYCTLAMVVFCIGATFSIKVLLRFIYMFLADVGASSGITAQVSLEKFIELFTSVVSLVGLFFEMPLVCVGLTRAGLINANVLKNVRDVVIVIIFVLSALITPPDVASQFIVALPMIALYQISIWICHFIGGKSDE